MKERKYIASVSGGKDSVCMLHYILEHPERYPLHHVVFVNTGMEFLAVIKVWEKVTEYLERVGIPYTMLDISEKFRYWMFDKPVCRQGTREVHRIGFGWCGGVCRWGTSMKTQAMNRLYKELYPEADVYEYVGIAADEPERLLNYADCKTKVYPLVENGITEAMALSECYKRGYTWEENGIRLYNHLSRVSCFCCGNKNLEELRFIFYKLPSYWKKLVDMEKRIGVPMKGDGKSLSELAVRFRREGYHYGLMELYG